MSLKDIVTLFKNHQIQYGLNGDSENQMQELYKWELVSKQNGHPDPNVVDFSKEIKSLNLSNLCFSSQITAIRNFAKYEPVRIPVDTRSLIPVISVHSISNLQYRRQS